MTDTVPLTLPAAIVPMLRAYLETNELQTVSSGINRHDNERFLDDITRFVVACRHFTPDEIARLSPDGWITFDVSVRLYEWIEDRLKRQNATERNMRSELITSTIIKWYFELSSRGFDSWPDVPSPDKNLRLALHEIIYGSRVSDVEGTAALIHAGGLLEEYERSKLEQWQRFFFKQDAMFYSHHIASDLAIYHSVIECLDHGWFGPKEGDLYQQEILLIWETLCEMDRKGNRGWYSQDLPGPAGRWLGTDKRYQIARRCMAFITGHGFRLRKKPRHWTQIIKSIFPETLADKEFTK